MTTSLRRQFAVVLFVLSILHSSSFFHKLHAESVQLPRTGQTKCYEIHGLEIACAGTGQDGDKQAGVAWPNPRFTDNNNGTVTDNLTGLVWLKNANCFGLQQRWLNAIASANNLASGACGLSDGSSAGQWRLPNRKELLSLVDFSQSVPALPSGHPFSAVQNDYYWSSSYSSYLTENIWAMDMRFGIMTPIGWSYMPRYVWPVRAGQSVSVTVKPSGAVPAGQGVSITGDAGALNCQWNGTVSSGVCTSNNIFFYTRVTLTASLPTDSQITWGIGCDSTTATTCKINNLTAKTTLSPVISTKTAQIITFNPPANKTFSDVPFDLGTYASGGASGNPVTFAVTSGPGSLTDSTLNITGVGDIVVTASQAGNANYSAAPDVQRTITVAKANVTIALANLNQVYDGTAKSVTATANPPNIGFVISYTDISGNPAVTRINAGDYNVSAIITDPNYQGSATGILTITKAPQTFTFNPLASIAYGAADFGPGAIPPEGQTINYTSDNQTVAAIIPAGLIHATGAGTAQITATISGDANHLPASIQQALTVKPAMLTVTAQNASRSYGAADPPFGASYSGFVNNETVSVLSGSPAFTTTATATSPVGSYPISVTTGNLSSANYTFSFVPGVLAIGKANAVVTLGNLSQAYDGTARSVTVTTIPPGLPVSITYNGSSTAPVNTGVYAVSAIINDPNYQGSTTGTLTITGVPQLTITANPRILWPANKKMVLVTIGGGVVLNGNETASLNISVADEYNKYNYNGLKFSDIVKLEASRKGDDKNGRTYTITAVLTLKDGRVFIAATTVKVPHDMSVDGHDDECDDSDQHKHDGNCHEKKEKHDRDDQDKREQDEHERHEDRK